MSASELSSALDMRPSVSSLLAKILAYRPTIVCFVGKDIWREFHFVVKAGTAGKDTKTKRKEKEKEEWNEPRRWKVVHPSDGGAVRETYIFVVSSTSGLCRDKVSFASTSSRMRFLSGLSDVGNFCFDCASDGATPRVLGQAQSVQDRAPPRSSSRCTRVGRQRLRGRFIQRG
jgi:hypothetical protein